MKLYTWGPAPNPRRVRMFLAEKGIEVPIEDVGDRAQLKPEFLAKSKHRLTPMLELDDGTMIGEAMAICRYFEALHPEPRLMGRDPKEMALIEMWERKAEFQGLQAGAEVFRNSLPAFADRGMGGYDVPIPQIPALIERGKVRVQAFCEQLDAQLAGHDYIVGNDFSVADITALVSVDFGKRQRMEIPASCENLQRWYARCSARPSAKL
ncbi:MAG: glutathione S-transferase family protein [Polyangiales bacterium]